MPIKPTFPQVEITSEVLRKWKDIVESLANSVQVPVALISHVDHTGIEVFASNKSPKNPYHPGFRFKKKESPPYCETVIQRGEKLLINNAATNDHWANSANLENGLISYLGFPLFLPNRQVFGTICLMDTKSIAFSTATETLLQHYKELVESHLDGLVKAKTLRIIRQKYSESLIKIQQLNKVLQLAAATDPITKLMNRRTFNDILHHEIARQRRNGGDICLVMAEIDGYENLKDQAENPPEEQVLVHVAAILRNRCRAQDFIWRWAEKEFLMALPETPLHGGIVLANKLRDALESQPAIIKREKHQVSMNFGVVSVKAEEPIRDSLNRCRRCLYKAQTKGNAQIESGE